MALAALLVILTVAARTGSEEPWFHEKVRQRIIAELERATGGAVTWGTTHFDWRRLSAEVTSVTLRGTEPRGRAPLFEAARSRSA